MDKRSIILVVIFFALVVVGMFIFAYLKKSEISEPATNVPVTNGQTEEVVAYPEIKRVDAKHYFIDGVHTFVGQLEMPTPCDLLTSEASVAESYPEQVTLNFSVINNAESCVQAITAQRFMITAAASKDASFKAKFMGRDIELNLIPAAVGEIPEEFELYIKG
jgi:hypothetical protein